MSEDHRTLHFGNPLRILITPEGAQRGIVDVTAADPGHPEGVRVATVLHLSGGVVTDGYGNRLSA